MAEFEAVILAGGRAARLAFADKPALEVGGVPMLVSVARAAAEAGAQGIVVVGPDRDGPVHDALVKLAAAMPGGLRVVREQPPSGGPVPALRRGLAEVTAPWLALLAADMPFLTGRQLGSVLARAVRGVGGTVGSVGGAVLTDDEGRPQWLAGCWRSGLLRAAVERYEGSSLHGLLSPLSPALVWPAAAGGVPPPWLDCDNPDDLAVARGLTDRNGELSDHSG